MYNHTQSHRRLIRIADWAINTTFNETPVASHTETEASVGFFLTFVDDRDFAFFMFERTKHQPRRHMRSYLILQRLCNEAALSPGIDAFWY